MIGLMDAATLKRLFNLVPHPREGGYYARTWESEEIIPHSALPDRYSAQRLAGTCIYYLLDPNSFSEIHRLQSDEIYHFYLGDPIELLMLHPNGSSKTVQVGSDIEKGQIPQLVIPKNVWQGSRLVSGGGFALIGCTVSPGFDFADYEAGSRAALIHAYPQYMDQIKALTRKP
jgi:uncharacterized protein